jgi:hypothetical protein
MASRHGGHSATRLPDGRVVVAGGIDQNWWSISAVEVFSPPVGPGQGSWTSVAALNPARSYHRAVLLDQGQVLLVGGLDTNWEPLDSVQIYDPLLDLHSATVALHDARSDFTLTALADGTVLATGGEQLDGPLDTAEEFRQSVLGDECATHGDCSVGACADGVCCNASCDGPCESCLASEKGFGLDGQCEPLVAGAVDPLCTDEGPESCGMTGLCAADGVCALYPDGTSCGPESCSKGARSGASCDGNGGCVQRSTSCEPYVCASATSCAESCAAHEDCAPDWYCAEAVCELKLPNESACTEDVECQSGICSQMVCASAAGCVGDTLLEVTGGEQIDCTPYRCRSGDCLTRCESILDCAPGLVCGADGVCKPPAPPATEEGGCSVGARQSGAGGLRWLLLMAMGACGLCARRSRARSTPGDGC